MVDRTPSRGNSVIFIVLMQPNAKAIEKGCQMWNGLFDQAYVVNATGVSGSVHSELYRGSMKVSSCTPRQLSSSFLRAEIQRCLEWCNTSSWFFFGSPNMFLCERSPHDRNYTKLFSFGFGFCLEISKRIGLFHNRIRWCPRELLKEICLHYAGHGEWEAVAYITRFHWTEERFILKDARGANAVFAVNQEPNASLYCIDCGFSKYVEGGYLLRCGNYPKALGCLLRSFHLNWLTKVYPEADTKYACCLLIGDVYAAMGKQFKSLCWYLRGMEYRPSRAECCTKACGIMEAQSLTTAAARIRGAFSVGGGRFFSRLLDSNPASHPPLSVLFPKSTTTLVRGCEDNAIPTSAYFFSGMTYVCCQTPSLEPGGGELYVYVLNRRSSLDPFMRLCLSDACANATCAHLILVDKTRLHFKVTISDEYGVCFKTLMLPKPGTQDTKMRLVKKRSYLPHRLTAQTGDTSLGTIEVVVEDQTRLYLTGSHFSGKRGFCHGPTGDKNLVKAVAYDVIRELLLLFWYNSGNKVLQLTTIPKSNITQLVIHKPRLIK